MKYQLLALPFNRIFNRRNYLCLLLMLFITQLTKSQNQISTTEISISKYGIEEGLRQSMVKQVYQDSRGLLWMVTGDGLNCFDGQTFKLFRVPAEVPFTQHDNMMRCLVETELNHFVVSTASSLCLFNSINAEFKIITKEIGSHPVLFPLLLNKKPLSWIYGKG